MQLKNIGLYLCMLLGVFTINAQTFDVRHSRELFDIQQMELNSFNRYFTTIFNIHGRTIRNPNVEKETNGRVSYSDRLRSMGVLKEEWKRYPVYFSPIQFEDGVQFARANYEGTPHRITKEITELMQDYFTENLGFSEVVEEFTIATLTTDLVKSNFFRSGIASEAAQLFTKQNFENITSVHAFKNGINVVPFFFKRNAYEVADFHISAYVFLGDVLLFTSTINLDLCDYTSYDVYYCDKSHDLVLFDEAKYLTQLVSTLFENIHSL